MFFIFWDGSSAGENAGLQFAISPPSGAEAAGREDQVLQRRGESAPRHPRLPVTTPV